MNAAAVEPASSAVATPRPQLFRLVMRREFNRTLLIILLLAPAATFAAASHAVGMPDGFGLMRWLIRRFDITVFIAALFVALLRVCVRVENDGREQWLDPIMASGARRAAYPLGVLTGVALTTAALFVIVAITFAVSVQIIAGTPELVHALPASLAKGLYIIAHWTLWATLIAVLLRSAPLSFGVAVILGALPWVGISMFASSDVMPPALLLNVGRFSPPLAPGSATLAWNIASATLMVVLVLILAERLTGRRM